MRTRLLVMVAVAAVTVASGRIAWAQTPCMTNVDCPDDGVFCNGTESCDTMIGQCVSSGDACNGLETCANQTCQAGTPVVCEDNDVCTTNTCDHATGACSFPAIAGCCNVDPDCNDNDACTTDTCDTVQHVCNHTPAVTCD